MMKEENFYQRLKELTRLMLSILILLKLPMVKAPKIRGVDNINVEYIDIVEAI